MTKHGPDHEERLAELLAGAQSDPDVARWLAECAECTELWNTLRAIPARLDAAAEDQRAVLAELARGTPAPGEEDVLATLERLAGPVARAPRRTNWNVVAVAAGIALVLGGWLAVRLFAPEPLPTPPPIWLGHGDLKPIAPVDVVDDFDHFEWRYSGQAAFYTLRIESDPDGTLLYELPRWTSTSWDPPPEVRAKLGKQIRWTVEAFDQEDVGVAVDSAAARASLP